MVLSGAPHHQYFRRRVRPGLARVDQVTGPQIEPSHDDPDIRRGSTVLGGLMGRHARPGSWRTPAALMVVVAALTYTASVLIRLPCIGTGFGGSSRYAGMCYSDIPVLYSLRGFAAGYLPYLEQSPDGRIFEYPVLTGAFAQVAAWITAPLGNNSIVFYAVNILLLGILFVVTVLATGFTVRGRVYDGMLLATAPALLASATINWDMLPLALVAMFLLFWFRTWVFWAGVMLGLAIAAKFYPVLFLGPLLLLCWRTGTLARFGRLLAGTVLAWLVVNVPIMLVNFAGWAEFYTFSQERGTDFGSIWLGLSIAGIGVPADVVNIVAMAVLIVACIGIAVLILAAPTTPRLAPMLFLVLAAFALTNKVYSPQYVMWLLPLAVLALPRLRPLLIWQAGELIYFAAIWLYLAELEDGGTGIPVGWYAVGIWVHIGVTLWFCGLLIRNTLRPEHDPLRQSGSAVDPEYQAMAKAAAPAKVAAAPVSPAERTAH